MLQLAAGRTSAAGSRPACPHKLPAVHQSRFRAFSAAAQQPEHVSRDRQRRVAHGSEAPRRSSCIANSGSSSIICEGEIAL